IARQDQARLKVRRCCLTLASRGCGQPDTEGLGSPGTRAPCRDLIPFPQRLRLLCAAKRVERFGSDVGSLTGEGVLPSKAVEVRGESRLAKTKRPVRIVHDKE